MNAMSPPSTNVIGARSPAEGRVPVAVDHDRIILTVARVAAAVLVALNYLRSALNITHGWGQELTPPRPSGLIAIQCGVRSG